MERSDTIILGILAHFRHFRHFSGLSRLGIEYQVLGIGYQVLGIRYWVLGTGFVVLTCFGFEFWNLRFICARPGATCLVYTTICFGFGDRGSDKIRH